MQDFTDQIAAIRSRLGEAAGYLRIDELKMRQPQLEAEASRPDLWDDQDKARKVTQEAIKEIEEIAELAADLGLPSGSPPGLASARQRLADLDDLLQHQDFSEARSTAAPAEKDGQRLQRDLDRRRQRSMGV